MATMSEGLESSYIAANVTPSSDDHHGHEVAQEDMKRFETALHLAVTIVFSLIIIVGIVGNLLVILVVSMNKHMRSSTNILLVNLAVADLSFILLCVFFTLFKFTGRWVFGDVWCKIMNYVNYICTWVSVYTLVLLCIDRVLAVVFAIKLRGVRSMRNGVIAIAVVWVTSCLVNVPALLFYGEFTYQAPDDGSEKTTCMFLMTISSNSKYAFQVCFFIFGFALPVFVISILYAILTVFLTRKSGPMAAGSTKTVSKAKRRVTVMVIVVVSAFVICWSPMQIIMLLNNFGLYRNDTAVAISLQIAANCLAYMNSCINPALYTMTSATFRAAFSNLLCCRQQGSAKPTAPVAKKEANGNSNNNVISNSNNNAAKAKSWSEEVKSEMEDTALINSQQTTA